MTPRIFAEGFDKSGPSVEFTAHYRARSRTCNCFKLHARVITANTKGQAHAHARRLGRDSGWTLRTLTPNDRED